MQIVDRYVVWTAVTEYDQSDILVENEFLLPMSPLGTVNEDPHF